MLHTLCTEHKCVFFTSWSTKLLHRQAFSFEYNDCRYRQMQNSTVHKTIHTLEALEYFLFGLFWTVEAATDVITINFKSNKPKIFFSFFFFKARRPPLTLSLQNLLLQLQIRLNHFQRRFDEKPEHRNDF